MDTATPESPQVCYLPSSLFVAPVLSSTPPAAVVANPRAAYTVPRHNRRPGESSSVPYAVCNKRGHGMTTTIHADVFIVYTDSHRRFGETREWSNISFSCAFFTCTRDKRGSLYYIISSRHVSVATTTSRSFLFGSVRRGPAAGPSSSRGESRRLPKTRALIIKTHDAAV